MLNIPNLTVNKECNRIMQNYLEIMVQNLLENLGTSNVKSIVLTGSLARGEGTARIINGNIEIYSDFDLNIFTSFYNQLKFNKTLQSLSKTYTDFFQKKGLLTHINVIPITESQIQKATTIRRVECIKTDKIIWGKDVLSNLKCTSKSIKKLDAIELLFNRIIDLLKILYVKSNNLKIYLLSKVILDLNTSILAFLGDYAPFYLTRMRLINNKKYLEWIPEAQFRELIQIVSKFKMNCNFDELISNYESLYQLTNNDSNELTQNIYEKSAHYLAEIMKKELCNLYHHKNCNKIDELKLLKEYLTNNSNFLKGFLLKSNIILMDPFGIKKYYKILLLKYHPKFFLHYIQYFLLRSQEKFHKFKKRYISEAYNGIKDSIDISSIKNWNLVIETFIKSQDIVLQRILK